MREELKQRLLKLVAFLDEELEDYSKFKPLTWKEYSDDRDKRRNVERWIENIVNSSVDISKTVLALERKTLPDTYKEIVSRLSLIEDPQFPHAELLAQQVRLRNIITHEYLDIKWSSISRFISETETIYREFSIGMKDYLRRKIEEDREEGK